MQDVFVSPNIASTSTASTSSHRGRKVQLPTTTSDDVFVSSPHTSVVEGEEGERKDSLNELDAVERSGTLQHVCTHTSSRGSGIIRHCANVLIIEPQNQMLCKITHCIGHISANIRLHSCAGGTRR